jgi:hypothetical protein
LAQIDIETRITAPTQITVPLVRADHHETANIFRVAFELFLAVTSALLGHVLALQEVARIHWVFLAVCALATIGFLVCSTKFNGRSKDV